MECVQSSSAEAVDAEVFINFKNEADNCDDQNKIGGKEGDSERKEVNAAEQVINALFFYKKFAISKLRRQADAILALSEKDRKLLIVPSLEHFRQVRECVAENQKVFDMIVTCGAHMLGGTIQQAFEITQLRPATEHYMTKVKSVLKQIVRDWSSEGAAERASCYQKVKEEMVKQFPEPTSRHSVQILVTGAGLARLAWDLLSLGFSVTGNEFSIFMLLASNFILNTCQQCNEFTIYPWVLDFSNAWSWKDQLRPVRFPDVNPCIVSSDQRLNTFSMCAGDFLQAYAADENHFDSVISVFFLDTAANPLEYIRHIHRILKPGGTWQNFGPLTYHHEDLDEVRSLELPFDQIVRLIEHCGFRIDQLLTKDHLPLSRYTWNPDSMLQYSYHCGYFQCSKAEEDKTM
uniref:carnosine N-methyltransferase n=1 Tax=Globodera rostochiensis TaxID=31243 RepID=A0A914HW64_GLORO